MKKVLAQATKFIFAAFGLAVLGLLMSLTYSALQRVFPDSFANQMWGLVLFDIAAICWALAFVFHSGTVGQYAVSGVGFLTAFIGTLGMVAAEVMLSGQTLVAADAARIGQWMVYGFIGVTALHVIFLYAHHFFSQDIHEKINVGIARGEIVTEAIKQAEKTLDVEKAELAHSITQDIVSQVKRDLGLMPIDDTIFDRRRNQLEVNMPPKEWEKLESDLTDKGFLEKSNLPKPTEEPCDECGRLPSLGHHHRCSQWHGFPAPEPYYHPVHPAPKPQDEPAVAKSPFPDSNSGGTDSASQLPI